MKLPVRGGCGSQWWGLTESRAKVDRRRSVICRIGNPRLYSSSSHDVESFDIRCGSSGSITVDIYNSRHLNSSRPLIIYLPPTGVHLRHTHPSIPPILISHPLAAINYRWNHVPSPPKSISNSSAFTSISDSHPFPTPLHDTLHAYTWLTTQYLPSLTSQPSPPPFYLDQNAYPTPPASPRSRSPYAASPPRFRTSPRPLIVYGSHLGGTLATSLALTECRDSKGVSFNIAGLIVRDGVFDWTSVATSLPAPKPSPVSPAEEASRISESLTTPWTLQTLHSLKSTLFTHPAYAFDSFASPTLFFKTPSMVVPKSQYFLGCEPPPPTPATADIETLCLSEAEYAALRSAEFDKISLSTASTEEKKVENPEEAETVRSYDQKFPPRNSGLKIPRSLFLANAASRPSGAGKARNSASRSARKSARKSSSGRVESASGSGEVEAEDGEDELAAQAQEMARLMRRSIVLHEFKDRVLWDEDADPHAVSEERVQLIQLKHNEDRREMQEEEKRIMGEWLEGVDY